MYTQLEPICLIMTYLHGLVPLSLTRRATKAAGSLLRKLQNSIRLLDSTRFFPLFQLPLLGMLARGVHLARMKATFRWPLNGVSLGKPSMNPTIRSKYWFPGVSTFFQSLLGDRGDGMASDFYSWLLIPPFRLYQTGFVLLFQEIPFIVCRMNWHPDWLFCSFYGLQFLLCSIANQSTGTASVFSIRHLSWLYLIQADSEWNGT